MKLIIQIGLDRLLGCYYTESMLDLEVQSGSPACQYIRRETPMKKTIMALLCAAMMLVTCSGAFAAEQVLSV